MTIRRIFSALGILSLGIFLALWTLSIVNAEDERIEILTYPEAGKISISFGSEYLKSFYPDTEFRLTISPWGSTQSKIQTNAKVPLEDEEIIWDIRSLPAGNYNLNITLATPQNEEKSVGKIVPFYWKGQPEPFKKIKILNNFVWELLSLSNKKTAKRPQRFEFFNPYDRWVFFKSEASLAGNSDLWVSLKTPSKEESVITHSDNTPTTQEAMRFLPVGRHALYLGGKGQAILKSLTVRSVPVLQYAFYETNPHVRPFGPYDWEFLSKDVLPNVNVMISSGRSEPVHLKEWKKAGKKWITITQVPETKETGEAAVQEIYNFWSNTMGLQHPLMDGIIVDEFGGGNEPVYDYYRQAVERIYANPNFKEKVFIPYGGSLFRQDRSTDFARASLKGGGYIALERYLSEKSTIPEAKKHIRQLLLNDMKNWETVNTGATRRMIMVLGYMSHPTESLNIDPSVNFNTYMDMQIRFLATHPAFFGLGGLQEYHCGYADEVTVRWAGRLFRHYAIEGKTEPLAIDPYVLSHILNPDFAEGEKGWVLGPAEKGSIKVLSFKGYSWLQGRYPRTNQGDTFLWLKRSSKRPNVLSQEIRDLIPGHLYSLKMITADYQNLIQEKSIKAEDALSIEIDNTEILQDPKNNFQFTYPNNYSHVLGKFNRNFPFWLNYHWRVFKAKATTARLIIKDWKKADNPGGPPGQELMINFIEVQPYID